MSSPNAERVREREKEWESRGTPFRLSLFLSLHCVIYFYQNSAPCRPPYLHRATGSPRGSFCSLAYTVTYALYVCICVYIRVLERFTLGYRTRISIYALALCVCLYVSWVVYVRVSWCVLIYREGCVYWAYTYTYTWRVRGERSHFFFLTIRSIRTHTVCICTRACFCTYTGANAPKEAAEHFAWHPSSFFLFFFISSCFVMTCNVRRRDRESEHDSLALSHGSNDYWFIDFHLFFCITAETIRVSTGIGGGPRAPCRPGLRTSHNSLVTSTET